MDREAVIKSIIEIYDSLPDEDNDAIYEKIIEYDMERYHRQSHTILHQEDQEKVARWEQLLNSIRESDIEYYETDSDRIPALSMRIDGKYGIFFNESHYETTAERLVALAHEKAHCDTGEMYSVFAPRITRELCEAKAWKRTIHDLIPLDNEFIELFRKCIYADGFYPCQGVCEIYF